MVHTYKTHEVLPAYEAPTSGDEDPFYIGYVICREKSEKKTIRLILVNNIVLTVINSSFRKPQLRLFEVKLFHTLI